MANESKIVEVIIKGQQANASINEMTSSARVLRAQLNKLPKDGEEWVRKSKEFQKVNDRLKTVKDEIYGVRSAWKDVAAGFTVGAIITQGLSAIYRGFQDSMRIAREFEASLKNLQAITGASSEDLVFYGEQAEIMGVRVEGGARAVVEAFKLIGSAKPELLENKEAMVEVTEAAILLSQAAGLELPEAATRLTDAMNQFNAPASQAGKYVDILAAAAKYGAAEVPDITEALLKFGVAAKSSNISIVESAASVELLAEKGIKGAEAGTALRNVFSKLSAADVLPANALEQLEKAGVDINILKDSTIPLSDRLRELSKIQGDASAITTVFGLENKIAGEILIGNIARLDELTASVNENGAAQEQAAINTDTETQRLLEQQNRIDLLSKSIGEKLTPAWGYLKEGVLLSIEGITSAVSQLFSESERTKSVMQQMGVSAEDASKLVKLGFNDMSGSFDEAKLRVQDVAGVMEGLNATQKSLSDNYVSGNATLDDYKSTIQNLTNAMLNQEVRTSAGGAKFYLLREAVANLKAEYAELSKQAETTTVTPPTATEELERIAAAEKYNDELKKLREKLHADLAKIDKENKYGALEPNEAELAKIEDEYKEVIALTEKFEKDLGDERVEITEAYAEKYVQALEKQFAKMTELQEKKRKEDIQRRAEVQAEVDQALMTDKEREIAAIEAKYADLIIRAEQTGVDTIELKKKEKEELEAVEQEHQDKIKAIKDQVEFELMDANQREIATTQAKYDELIRLAEEANMSTVELEKKKADEIEKINRDSEKKVATEKIKKVEFYVKEATKIGDDFIALQKNRSANEIRRHYTELEQKQQANDQALANGLISQKEHDAKDLQLKNNYDNETKKIREKQFKLEQGMKLAQVAMNLAMELSYLAVAAAANPTNAVTFGVAGVTQYAIQAGIAVVRSGLQVATILSTPKPYAAGGYNKTSDDPQGYTTDSTLYTNSASGSDFIAGEAGKEWIAPNWMIESPQTAPVIQHLEAVRQSRSFATGGSTSVAQTKAEVSPMAISTGSVNNDQLLVAITKLNNILDGGIEAYIDYNRFEDDRADIEKSKDFARVG